MLQFLCKKFWVFNIHIAQNYDVSYNFKQSSLRFSQQNYDNFEIPWHTIKLSYNYRKFDIEIVTIVKYLKSLLCHMKKIPTFATTRFLKTNLFVSSGINDTSRISCGKIRWKMLFGIIHGYFVVNRVLFGEKAKRFWQ